MSACRPFLIALLLSVAAFGAAANKEVENLLAQMRKAYGEVKAATFTCESSFFAGRSAGESPSVVYVNSFSYKSPSLVRLDITSRSSKDFKSSLVKVSDGKSIAMKLPNETTFSHQEFSIDNFELNLPVNLESFSFWDSDRQLSTAPGKNMEHSSLKIVEGQDWNGKKWTVLEETATEQKLFCRYFVDPKTFLIWRTTVRPIGGSFDLQDSKITKLDLAPKLTGATFRLPAE